MIERLQLRKLKLASRAYWYANFDGGVRKMRYTLAARRPDLLAVFDQILGGSTRALPNIWYGPEKSILPSALATASLI